MPVQRVFAATGIIALLLLASCTRTEMSDKVPDKGRVYSPAYGDVIVEGTIADPAILNPVLASDSASSDVTGLIFSSMLRYDKDLNLEGELAENWEISPDGKIITFKLKPGIKWQDGMPLTAQDVEFTLRTYLNPKVKTAYRSNYENIVKSQVLDEYTFRVWYKEPFAPSLEKMGGMPILPKHLLKGRDVNKADDFNFRPVGSGPYKFVSWKRAESVMLKANPEYFEGRPYLNRVVFRVIPDMSVQFLELQNGALDMMGLTPNQFTGEANTPDFNRRFNKYRYTGNQYTYLGFNLQKPMFQDKRFREALDMAIDKEAIVKGVLEGLGAVCTGPLTPSSWAFNPDVKPRPYDPLRARELFVEAGYRYNKDGKLMKDGKQAEFTILTNQGNRTREQTATILQSQLKEVGIQVNIRIIAWSTFLTEFVNKRKFDVVLLGWALARDPDLYNIWHSSQTGEHEFNFVNYKNPEVDRLLVEGRQTYSRDRRILIYHRLHEKIAEELPYIFLYVPDNLPAVQVRIQGIEPAAAGIGYNFIKWFVPEGYHKYAE
ncbi:peptide-binding protein [candidate division FCPU426 bacterium]|nr:peptide-binding protein [candidate division FCPU426 bacterium]